jgi:hypothetical protein
MKRCFTLLLLGVVTVTGLPSSRAAARAEFPNERAAALALFRGDARLNAHVTLARKERPLSEVLGQLGSQLQVRLSANRATADDRVTLFLDDRPIAEVLALLADQFDFHWSRDGDGYRLEHLPSAQRREADLRSAYLQRHWDSSLALVQQINRLSQLTRQQRDDRQVEVAIALRTEGLSRDEAAALFLEQGAFNGLDSPTAELSSRLLCARLTATQLQQLRQGKTLRLSTLDQSLNPELVRQIEAAGSPLRKEQREPVPRTDLLVQFQEIAPLTRFPPEIYAPRWNLRIELPYGTSRNGGPMAWNASPPLADPDLAVELPADPFWKRELRPYPPAEPLLQNVTDLSL